MPLDTNLALYDTSPKLENPLNAMMNREQLQAARSTNAFNSLKLKKDQEALDRQNALLGKIKGLKIDSPETAQAYTEAGLGEEYGKIREQNAKADLEASNLIDKNLARFRSFAPQVQDLNGVKSYVDSMYQDKILGKMAADMKPYEQALKENLDLFQKDPAQWQVAHANLTGQQVLDTYKKTQAKQDLGGTVQTTTFDSFGRPVGAPVSTPKTATPGEVLTNARAKAAQDLLERKFAYEKANPGYTVQEAGDGSLIAINKNNPRDVQPVSMGGVPVQKMPEAAKKEIMSINQQRSTINGALNAVEKAPDAFSYKRGAMGKVSESLAGRTETPEQTQARAYVFNNVSSVIKERAGAAQSAQELQRINAFLPSDTDNSTQIKNKLTGFLNYLNDLEAGTKGQPTQIKESENNSGLSPAEQKELEQLRSRFGKGGK